MPLAGSLLQLQPSSAVDSTRACLPGWSLISGAALASCFIPSPVPSYLSLYLSIYLSIYLCLSATFSIWPWRETARTISIKFGT